MGEVFICRYLAEGILPTTNEISVLKFAEHGTSSNGSGSSSDDEGVTMKVCVACGLLLSASVLDVVCGPVCSIYSCLTSAALQTARHSITVCQQCQHLTKATEPQLRGVCHAELGSQAWSACMPAGRFL